MDDSDSDEDKKPEKPAPKKIENTFEKDMSETVTRSQTVKQPAAKPLEKPEGEGDEFKNTLAAMLARGPMGRGTVAPAKKQNTVVEEEKKVPIKLSVFEDDAQEEMEQVKKMAAREEPDSSEPAHIGRGMSLKKKRKLSKKMTSFEESDDEDE